MKLYRLVACVALLVVGRATAQTSTPDVREEQIAALKRLLTTAPKGGRADYLFRLAELTWNKSRTLYGQEIERGREHRESELYAAEAVRLYEGVLEDAPSYERRDEVRFNLASAKMESQRGDDARSELRSLLESSPNSPFAGDALLLLGNDAFDRLNDVVAARQYFERAMRSGNQRIARYAVYKLAWCDFNEANYLGARAKLEETVAAAGGAGATDLQREALDDLVRVHVRIGDAQTATTYFRAHATGQRLTTLLAKLASGFAQSGQSEKALALYRNLLAEAPMDVQAPTYATQVVEALQALGRRDEVRFEVVAMSRSYAPGSAWWGKQDAARAREGFTVAEATVREVAIELHQEAQKTAIAGTRSAARDVYRAYLDAFASSSDESLVSDYAFNMRFYLAEVLWELGEWENAARAYRAVVTAKVPTRVLARQMADDSYRKRAAYNELLAWSKLARPKPTSPLIPAERELLQAADTFVQAFPDSPERSEVEFAAATLAAEGGEGGERLTRFVKSFPSDPRAHQAAERVMAMWEASGNLEALDTHPRAWLADEKFAPPGSPWRAQLERIADGARYKYLDEVVYRKEKDSARAVTGFLDLVARAPNSPFADRALLFAMELVGDEPNRSRAASLGEQFFRDYPKSPLLPQVLLGMARHYEVMAEYRLAAEAARKYLTSVAARAPGLKPSESSEVQPSSLMFRMGLWLEAAGEYGMAATVWKDFARTYPQDADAGTAALKVGEMFARLGRAADADQAYLNCQQMPKVPPLVALEAMRRRLDAAVARGDASAIVRARSLRDAALRLPPSARSDSGAVAALAQAEFALAEPAYAACRALKLPQGAALRGALQSKLRCVSNVSTAYAKVIEIGDARQAVAGLTRIGLLYGDFASNVARIPTPAGFDPEQQALFRSELETQYVLPLATKAAEALDLALAKTSELGTYSAATNQAEDELNRLRPGSFPPPPKLAWVGVAPPSAAEEQGARARLQRGSPHALDYEVLARGALHAQRFSEARALCRAALALDVAHGPTLNTLGVLQTEDRAYAEALATFHRATDNVDAAYNAAVLALNFRDYLAAERMLTDVQGKAQGRYDVRMAFGFALYGQRTASPAKSLQAGKVFEAARIAGAPASTASCAAAWAYAATPAGFETAIPAFVECEKVTSDPAEIARMRREVSALRAMRAAQSDGGAP